MTRLHLVNRPLLWVLEALVQGQVHNEIVVPDDQKRWTRVALDRMLSIS